MQHFNSQGIQVEFLSACEACCPRALIAKSIRPIFSTSHSPPDRDIRFSETAIAILHTTYEYRMLVPLPPTHPSSLCPAGLLRIKIYWDPPCCSGGIIHMALRWWAHIRWTECTVRHCPFVQAASQTALSATRLCSMEAPLQPPYVSHIRYSGTVLPIGLGQSRVRTIPQHHDYFIHSRQGGRHYHTHTPLRIPLAKNV
jgi:hypothetical protein